VVSNFAMDHYPSMLENGVKSQGKKLRILDAEVVGAKRITGAAGHNAI